jgi:hypothetical protein
MLIYLCSLPIWNFVLPVYAYWHFDDFSWGETRKIEGEGAAKPETGHGDKEGVFDSTSIVMKVRLSLPVPLQRARRQESETDDFTTMFDFDCSVGPSLSESVDGRVERRAETQVTISLSARRLREGATTDT